MEIDSSSETDKSFLNSVDLFQNKRLNTKRKSSFFLQVDNYFVQRGMQLLEIFLMKDSYQKSKKIHLLLEKIYIDCSNDQQASLAIVHLENHQNFIENLLFNWEEEQQGLKQIHPLIQFFDLFDDFSLKFTNLDKIRQLLPLRIFKNYFTKPYFYNREKRVLYQNVLGFHSDLLSVLDKLYLRSFMNKNNIIDASVITSYDPFMRIFIRRENLEFFKTSFIDNKFSFIEFIKDIIDDFDLQELLHWRIEKNKPMVITLFQLLKNLFDYGLVEVDETKEILKYLYLVCESLASIEKVLQEELEGKWDYVNQEFNKKYRNELLDCKESVCLILIHIISIYCDKAIEQTQIQFINGNFDSKLFPKFIFKEKTVLNYLSYIVFEYLTQKIVLGTFHITSKSLDTNLSIIYNFLSNYQNGFLRLSMELVKRRDFDYYYIHLKDQFQSQQKNVYNIVMQIDNELKNWIDQIDYNKSQSYHLESFRKLLNRIEVQLRLNRNNIYFILELTKKNFPVLFLKVLDFLDDGNLENEDLIIRSIKIMKIIFYKNYSAQASLFQDRCKISFQNLALKRPSILLLLTNIFENDFSIFFACSQLFFNSLKYYDNIYNIPAEDEDYLTVSKDDIIRVILFQKFFFNLLDQHFVKIIRRKHFDLVLNLYLYPKFKKFINYFLRLDDIPEIIVKDIQLHLPDKFFNLDQIENFFDHIKNTNQDKLFYQFVFNFFKLFSKCVYNIYSGHIYRDFHKKIEYLVRLLTNMNYKYQDSILLRLQYIKLYDKFKVFFANHLITDRIRYNQNPSSILGEVYILKNYKSIQKFIDEEFTWFDKYQQFYENTENVEIKQNMIKYLKKGLLALIYKFLKGYQVHLSILMKDRNLETLLFSITQIVDQITERCKKYEFLLLNKIRDFEFMQIQNDLKFKQKQYEEEKPFQFFELIREKISFGINLLNDYYDKDLIYIIDQYKRENSISKQNEFMSSKFEFSLRIQNIFGKQKKFSYKKSSKSLYDQFYKPLKQKYLQYKAQYFKNKKKNIFLQIFLDPLNERFVVTFLKFFINKIMKMGILVKGKDYNFQFIINHHYTYFFIILNNFMEYHPRLNNIFLEIIENDEYQNWNKNVLLQCWKCFLMLYINVVHKTFMDTTWDEFWSKFFVISIFFQNLCEGNQSGFKVYLNSDQAPGAISFFNPDFKHKNTNLFYELYAIVEALSDYTNVWSNKFSQIVPSDKKEIFPIIKRLMDQLVVYLVGSNVENRMIIYNHRFDIWSGIITRIVDDTDSDFYKLKMSCLIYITTLLEEMDDKIVNFMGRHFLISQLFDLFITLMKKLFVRTSRIIQIQKDNKLTAEQVVKQYDNVVIVTKEEQNEFLIQNNKDLLSFYSLHQFFEKHVLLKIIIEIVFIIKYISIKMNTYKFFMEKIDYESNRINLIKKLTKKQQFFIYNFTKIIISDIEVIIIKSKNKKMLKKIFFQKEAKCFLLSKSTQNKYKDHINFIEGHQYKIFFDKVNEFELEMNYNLWILHKIGIFYPFSSQDSFRTYQIILYFLSIVLNIILLFGLVSDHVETREDIVTWTYIENSTVQIIMIIFPILVICYSGILSIFWLITKYQLEANTNLFITRKKKGKISLKQTIYIRFFISLLLHPRFSSFYLHFIFSILGLAVNKWFFTLNLFMVTNISKTINYVMRSLITHYDKILITFFMIIIIIMFYSFLLFRFYADAIIQPNFCPNFLSCFLNSINLGLRSSDGISDTLFPVVRPKDNNYWNRLLFDFTFYVMIKLILLNIIAGIIIDTFSELREKLVNVNFNINYVCFVCGLTKWQIEKMGQNFTEHKKFTHNLWKYIYFIIGLLNRFDYLSSEEYYIYKKTQNDDFSWIPTGTFLNDHETIRYFT